MDKKKSEELIEVIYREHVGSLVRQARESLALVNTFLKDNLKDSVNALCAIKELDGIGTQSVPICFSYKNLHLLCGLNKQRREDIEKHLLRLLVAAPENFIVDRTSKESIEFLRHLGRVPVLCRKAVNAIDAISVLFYQGY